MKEKNYFDIDNRLIFYEQKQVLQKLFDKVDLSKIVFVGGIADYLNLRDHYYLTVNDVDVAYENESDLQPFLETYPCERFKSKFYGIFSDTVIIADLPVGEKVVHFDFFQRKINYDRVKTTKLLGKKVLHMNFDAMRNFHNKEIGKQISKVAQKEYEWKRLYKHSIKASLYNFIYHDLDKEYRELPMRCALTK